MFDLSSLLALLLRFSDVGSMLDEFFASPLYLLLIWILNLAGVFD
jgi:hypothetical protein